jgi:hypothetical protein
MVQVEGGIGLHVQQWRGMTPKRRGSICRAWMGYEAMV